MTDKETSEFITFPKTFEKYRWYNPILVFIVGLIIFFILTEILTQVSIAIYGENLIMSIANGGYDILNTEIGQIFTDLGVIIMIPSLYLATKITHLNLGYFFIAFSSKTFEDCEGINSSS